MMYKYENAEKKIVIHIMHNMKMMKQRRHVMRKYENYEPSCKSMKDENMQIMEQDFLPSGLASVFPASFPHSFLPSLGKAPTKTSGRSSLELDLALEVDDAVTHAVIAYYTLNPRS